MIQVCHVFLTPPHGTHRLGLDECRTQTSSSSGGVAQVDIVLTVLESEFMNSFHQLHVIEVMLHPMLLMLISIDLSLLRECL